MLTIGPRYCDYIINNIKCGNDGDKDHYDNHLSTDLLFTHHEIKTIATVKYQKNQWYA
jgi:hypothetical protein